MVNFDYCTPTRLVFGKGVIEKLPAIMSPLGKKILLVYGGGSIKKTGLYDKVLELLSDFEIFELSGVEPNPKYESVVEGAKICRENNVDAVLAVGGGSVLDCSKSIAAGAKYDGDPWDLITYKVPTTSALPIVDIMTLSATGSEYDANSVISRMDLNIKTCLKSDHIFPTCSILDPTYTFTVSKRQTAAGAADAISHVFEKYFTSPTTDLNDGMCEAVIKSIMKNVKVALENPCDYDARAELMVDCALACNNIIALGNGASGWVAHAIEHALSAYYDITHGEGLAIITPHWMRKILSEKTADRFVKYGVNIWGIDPGLDSFEIANKAIDKTYEFFRSLGIPMTLGEVGIDDAKINEMANDIAGDGKLKNCYAPLSVEDVAEILRNSL
ncbi:MAG: iron-containing alcohol dehydrogenase [Oscillospiraceae bacterium]|nr:iron-containing alcohol dehydrogenase [Oscillospiraceae bacterium]